MKSPTAGRTAWILTTVGLLFALICLRFALNFKTSFPPSTDEVYEVLQGHATTTEFWSGGVELAPGKLVTFRAELDLQSTPPIGYLWVGDERVPVPEISVDGNSLVLSFSEYGAEMRGTLQGKTWSGEYLRHRTEGTKSFKFSAIAVASAAAPLETRPPLGSFTVKFDDEKETQGQTSAKFWMNGDLAFGTFIAPDGDYGLLEGRSAGKGRVEFHRFTGWQATRIDLTLTGNKWTGSFLAHSIDKPRGFTLAASAESVAARQTRMKDPESVFEFACASPTGQVVRNTDFKGKPLIVDIMGTWCHNCLDSAPVLQELQNRYGQRGLQVVGLSFEIRDDKKLAEKNLNLFKRRFGLTYPVLFCGDLSDSNVDRQLKSQLDNFFAYPTTLFVDRSGKVKTIHSGFKGPGTGNEFANQVTAFHELASELVPGTR